FYFLEMNTRLQVEHPVTEAVTGLDLVEWQLRIAAGQPLPRQQDQLRQSGHAIEARVYSEDPRKGFLPAVGRVERFAFPPEDGSWRVDRGIDDGDTITPYYDPMVAKVIASGSDRATAIGRLGDCLARTAVFGPASNLELLRSIVAHPAFLEGAMDTGYLDRHLQDLLSSPPSPGVPALLAAADYALRALATPGQERSPWARADAWRLGGLDGVTLGLLAPAFRRLRARRRGAVVEISGEGLDAKGSVVAGEHDAVTVDCDGQRREVTVVAHGTRLVVTDRTTHELRVVHPWPFETGVDDVDIHPASPLPGRVVSVLVATGDSVVAGQALAVVEGMKMQHTVKAG
ncbi:MAG TPA: biotin/lipoyl-containing protein, partial [Pseudomonadales bacterium]|nr:biotin/lipoyl-containing protein [Pseudomonadales bacterium]